MRILFVSAEVYPFSKTGGLGDVAGALPEALVKLGHEVLVVSPWYKTLKANPAPLWIDDVSVPFDGDFTSCGVGTLSHNGVRYAFVGHDYFQRDSLYGYHDDVKRFCLFSRAVPQVAAREQFLPDVVHANDWHSAYLPMLLSDGWHMPDGFSHLPSVFTIHNVQYQGNSGLDETLYWLRLPGELRDNYMNYFGSANAMQAGAGFAHHITTVSPTYANELQSPEYAYGLDGTFRHLSHKLSGILNGIDLDIWNPETDPYLSHTYSSASLENKQALKDAFCREFHLDPSRPILGLVSRLADQKGIDFFLAAADELLWQDWNLMILGSGEAWMEASVHHLTAQHAGRVASHVGYSEAIAHRVYAASDALIVPSRFEPCGLSQMIAMRYGTLPIARETGGLKDTIKHGETGFLFAYTSAESLLWGTNVARQQFNNREQWTNLMQTAMKQDFSWENSAKQYVDIYKKVAHAS